MLVNESLFEIEEDAELAKTLPALIPMGLGLYVLSFTTFVGNAMVLHAIRTEKRLQTVSNMFIMSLASADLTVGLIVMPISSAYALTDDWQFGYVVCQFWLVVDYTASTASIFNLCILSLDRYWSISTPLKYLRKRTKKRALIMIALAWMASAMWFIPVLGWHHILYNGKRQQPEGVCDTEFATNITFKVVTSILNFYIPVTLMIVINVRIFLAIRRRSEDIDRLGATTSGMVLSSANQTTNVAASCQDDLACDSLTEHDHVENEYCQVHKKKKIFPTKRKKRKKKRKVLNGDGEPSEIKGHSARFVRSSIVEFHKLSVMTVKTENNHSSQTSGNSFRSKDSESLTVFEGVTVNVEYVSNSAANADSEDSLRRNKADKSTHICKHLNNNNLLHPNSDHSNHLHCYRSSKKKNSSSNSYQGKMTNSSSSFTEDDDEDDDAKSSSPERGRFATFLWSKKRRRRTDLLLSSRCSPSNLTAANLGAVLAKEKKAATQLGVIVGAFILCWLPYFTLFMVVAYCGHANQCVNPDVHTATIWFGYFNSTLNPILYPLCNTNFKRAFKRMFRFSSTSSQQQHNTHHHYSYPAINKI